MHQDYFVLVSIILCNKSFLFQPCVHSILISQVHESHGKCHLRFKPEKKLKRAGGFEIKT